MGGRRSRSKGLTRLSLVAVASVALLVLGFAPGAARAGVQVAKGAVNASGTLGCTVSKGKLVVKPGLMFTGVATSATFTFTGDLTCTGTSGVTGGKFTATGTSASNNCGTLAELGIPSITTSIKWYGKWNPTTIIFSNGNFGIGASASINLPSTGPNPATGSSTVSGSFGFEPATATFVADQAIATFDADCSSSTTGLTGFTFTGVFAPSTLDISEQQTETPPPPPASGPVTVGVDASSPGAAVNQGLVGVNHIADGSQADLAAMGVTWARTDVSFELNAGTPEAAYNCTTGVWNPSYLDGNVALNQQAGAQTQLIVDYFPPCLQDQSVAANRKKWEQLVLTMAEHEISAEGVTVFEVWNEPSFRMPLNGSNGYLELYKDTATALEKAAAVEHVQIEVGGPGNDDLGQIDNSWIVALASYVVKHKLPLDFVSWHMYANDPDEGPQQGLPFGVCDTGTPVGGQPCWYNPSLDVSLYARSAESVRSALAQFPTLHPLLWVDEWGIDSGNDARLNGPYGAAFIAASLASAEQGGIDRMSYYDAADSPAPTYNNFGLLTSTFMPKPAYYAFDMWHQLAGSLLPVTLTPDQTDTGPVGQIGSVASLAANGSVQVMVYNFAPYDPSGVYGTTDPTPFDHQVTVDLSGLSAGTYSVSSSLVDGQNDDTTSVGSPVAGPAASLTFNLSGEGVTLITLTPTS
jgi:Glycosyl hydrolases family 39